eukprot:XP_001704264.1 Hypothetical protein GL50803_21570 [Giardia lamblia ATCC 50803]
MTKEEPHASSSKAIEKATESLQLAMAPITCHAHRDGLTM